MFGDGSLTFREFIRRERVPLARAHDAVLEFLRNRKDAVLCDAHAVNAYVTVALNQDVDIASTRAPALAAELQSFLSLRFSMHLRIDEIRNGQGYRIKPKRRQAHRHLVD